MLIVELPSSIPFSFDQIMTLEGQLFRQVKNRKTLKFEHENKNYFVKLHWGVGWWEIFKNLLQGRLPIISASNEWNAIKRLDELNINTTPLVGYGCRGRNPAKRQSFVITEALTNTVSLEDFCSHWKKSPPDFRLKRALIAKVATVARTLHEHGVNHRDFYLCHFLLDKDFDSSQQLRLFLIDLHRVQLRRRTSERWKIKDIAGLYFSAMDIGLTQRDIFYFIKNYTGKSLRKNLEKKRFWQKTKRRAVKLYAKTFFMQQQSWKHFILFDSRYDSSGLQNTLEHIEESLQNATVLKQDATTRVGTIIINNQRFVIKCYPIKNARHALKRCCAKSRAQKCWDNAHHLIWLGIPTPKPVALFENRIGFLRGRAYYIYEHIDGVHALDYFKHQVSSNLIDKIVVIFKKLASGLISHGDMKATNIIVSNDQPALIDLDSMRFYRNAYFFRNANKKDLQRFMKNWESMPAPKKEFERAFRRARLWM